MADPPCSLLCCSVLCAHTLQAYEGQSMQSMHDVHVDLVRLLAATERLVAVQNVSADGSWEHWPRFCQYITSLDNIQSQLQARVLEGSRGVGGEGIDTTNQGPPEATAPSAQDLAAYDQRLENLRRERDDLVSAAAAAAAAAETAADVELSEQQEQQRQQELSFADAAAGRAGEGGGGSEGNRSDGRMEQQGQRREATAREFSSTSQASRNNDKNRRMYEYGDTRGGGGGGGDGLFGVRGRRQAGGVGGRAADEAEADEVAQEISSMAGRLKESSMAINQTLRTQTQVLENTGDAATMNVDRVKRENVRVAERLRKKRAAMFASWCMMITVLAVFFATYALVILPFEKRRGPFVATRSPTFAHAAEQNPPIPSQQIEGDSAGEEDPRKRAERAYSEASRRARSREKSDNAAHRVANAEKEAFRERQAERMMASAKERKAGMRRKGLEKQQAQIEVARNLEEENEGLDGLPAGSCSAPPSDGDDYAAAVDVGSCSGPPPSDEDDDIIGDGMGGCSAPPSDGDGDPASAVGSCSVPRSDEDGDSAAADIGSCSAPPSDEDDDHTAAGFGSCNAPPSDGVAGASEDTAESRIDLSAFDDATSADARKETAAATPPALNPEAAKAGEEYRRKAQLAYEERARREAQRIESSNAGLRLVAEEKEKYRQRQAQEMMQRATERKGKASAVKKAREAQLATASAASSGREADEEDAESSLRARTVDSGGEVIGNESESGVGTGRQQDGGGDEDNKEVFDDVHREGTVTASDGDSSTTGADAAGESSDEGSSDEGSSVFTPSAEAREVERRLAEEAKLAYERNARQAEDTLATQNAGLRLVAEEKEKYRQRQTRSILESAKHRKQQQQQEEEQRQLQQHGEAGDQPEARESQPPIPKSGTEDNVDGPVSTSASSAAGAASGSATGGGGGRGEGLEAVRMRLRESLSSKRGGGEGEARDSNSNTNSE